MENNSFSRYFNLIIPLLDDGEYGIDSGAAERLRAMSDTAVYTTRGLPDTITLTDTEGRERALYDVVTRRPQVIDPRPLVLGGKFTPFRPVIVIPEEDEKCSAWKTIHEICHLLSVGGYRESGNGVFFHCFGLNQYSYRRVSWEGKPRMVGRREFPIKNEIFNDAVTWHFMERLAGECVLPPDEFTSANCRGLKESEGFKKLIGMYFSGDPESAGRLAEYVIK